MNEQSNKEIDEKIINENNEDIKTTTIKDQTISQQNPQNINTKQQIANITNPNQTTITKSENEDQEAESGGCLKQILLPVFLVSIIVFAFFLPEISSFISSKKNHTSEENIKSGVLVCSLEQENDTSEIEYTAKFNYIDNKLKTSSMTISVQDENDINITNRISSCQNMSTISTSLKGIEVECRPSANMIVITENYDYQAIDKNNLTKFTEAGGTYPEFKYQEDIEKVKSSMKKNGYACREE